ncbi:TRAP transporter large permease [Desulfopila inferna]|uniref:TRAP transporter large permease n=1 Tax=Desulfopila inferna TaxID=468528 RepID=UPI001963AF32|nr:TRAP transporter large permease [Desulfopila inferna]MBM9603117.1 TRAP transporter large permease [Desulfopila inferna]
MIYVLMGTMIFLLLLGFPMFVPLAVGAFATVMIYFPFVDPSMLVQQIIGGVQPVSLIAVPMFIFAADIMTSGQVATRLLDFVLKFVGHKRGGLPIATTTACTLFGAVSGSTQATVVAVGGPLRPLLLKAGYSSSYSTALIINAAVIALLIPPSVYMIVYGVVAGASVGELFVAGVGPGLLIWLLFCIYSWLVSKESLQAEPAPWKERMKALKKALMSFTFPVIIFGGIYSGIFSPTEAAAVSVLYAFILEFFIYKSLLLKDIPKIALRTGMITAIVFILIAMGQVFSWTVSFARIPNMILPPLLGEGPTEFRILMVLSLAYFLGCMFVDPIVVIMILTPIFKPAITASGLDTVLIGTIVTLQAAIGSTTPPFGCNIFTAIAIFKQDYWDAVRGVFPFIAIMMLVSLLLILYPPLALFLRDMMIQ